MKNIKSLLSLGIALLMVISLFNTSVVTAIAVDTNVVSSGAIGGTVGECTWQYVSAIGKLIISGNGSMGCIEDEYNQPWADYSENINCVQIDEGVTEISDYAFYELNISEVSIPNTVETIGNEAFYCTQLKKITIPDSVTVIKEKAFSSCHNLESVTIGSGVELIGKDAFNWDEFAPEDYEINYPYFDRVNITDLSKWCSIKFDNAGSNPLYSGNNIYIDNKNVTALKIPSGVKSISDYAFCGSSIKSVSLFDSVETIGESAFEGCSELKEVKIPKSLKQVNENAFLNASALNKVCYEGKQDEWYNIDFYNGNSNLLNAEIVYNYISNESESVPVHKYYYEHLYIAGDSNGDSGFLHGINWTPTAAANEMVTTDGVCYTITFNGVGAGTYNWKICADDSWTVQWGLGDGVDNGIAVYQGMNLKLNVTAYSDVTITVDFSNYNPETNNSVKYNVIIVPNQNATTEPTSKQTEPSTDNKLINGYYPVGSAELFGMYWQPNQKYRMNYYAGYYYVDITNVKSGDYECKVIYYDNGSYEWYPDGMGNGLNFYVDDNSTVRIILNPHSREPYVEIYNHGETVPTFKPPVEPTNPTEKTEPVTNATEPIISYTEPTTIATETTDTYENSPKTTVQFNKSIATIYRKAQLQIKPIITNGRGKTTYNTSNSNIATVDASGKVTGISKGTAIITVTNNGVSAEFKVTVNNPKLNITSKTIKVLDTFNLTVKGKVGTPKFSSNNKKVATVNSSGKVRGVSNGTATIKVNTNGLVLKCKVKVNGLKIKKLSKVKNGFTASISVPKGIKNYSIQYSRTKKFKMSKMGYQIYQKRKSKVKITWLESGAKYYVRLCYAKTIGDKVYRSYSNVKTIRIKGISYKKYKGTWKNGSNKIVIKSVSGNSIKVYLFTKYAFGDRFADATAYGTIKNNSAKLYFTDS